MPRPLFDALLFDIDNVLIDTRASYLTAIQKTVERYLNRPGIVSLKEIDRFKLLGGFNDDWDCCDGVITFFKTTLQGKPLGLRNRGRQRLSITKLGSLFPTRPLGIKGLVKGLRALYPRVKRASYKKITRIFQEVYLGKGDKRRGLIQKEKLIFPKALLKKIRSRGIRLGLVTGRNRFETHYALKRFGLAKFFDCLVSVDDVRREEKKRKTLLRKPHPWPILKAAERLQRGKTSRLRFLYVGDLPDDILAARRARKSIPIQSVAFPKLSQDAQAGLQEFKKVKPDFILRRPRDLLKILFP